MARTVEDMAAALQATAGYDGYDPRQTRDVPERVDVLGRLADGVTGLRVGVLQEGFDDAERDVHDLVLAAVDVLARIGAEVSKVSIPAHHAVRTAQAALNAEGNLALFRTGFFGAFTRTYYPASLIAAINKLWAERADVLAPRTKLSLIGDSAAAPPAALRRGPERAAYIGAYDAALADVDVLVMPTCIMTAQEPPAGYVPQAVEDICCRRAEA
jgi:amidase